MHFSQQPVSNPLTTRSSLNNCHASVNDEFPKKLPQKLRQSITITNGYFCSDIMRQIEHCNNLDLNKIIMKQPRIGCGTSAIVHLALYNHRYIALKEYKLNDSNSDLNDATLSEFQNELNILKLLHNPHIIQFFGFHLNIHKKVLKFAFEYCPNGSLFDIIHPLLDAPKYKYKHILNMLLDIAKGMKYIHSRNIINRDSIAKGMHFWYKHIHGLLSIDHHQHKYNKRSFEMYRSLIIAVSCFSYLIPAIWMVNVISRSSKWIDFMIYTLTSGISFCGDYCYVDGTNKNMSCIISMLDQWTATCAILFNFGKCYIFFDSTLDYFWMSSVSIIAFTLLKCSRECESMKQWILWHSVWHFWAAFVNLLVILNEVMY